MTSGSSSNAAYKPFRPRPWLRNAHLQSILASSRIRASGPNPMADAARMMILETGDGTRLMGYFSENPEADGSGLVTLLHGWEGSADSAYILSTARYLYRKGFSIFRLNYRDHGDSHHLNEGLFHGALLDETFSGVLQSSKLAGRNPFFIIGFSLGANFAMRIALRHACEPISGLKHVMAISPSLNPHRTTLAVDQGPLIYRLYFMRKWKRSLRKKEAISPHRYHFGDILKEKTLLGLTEALRDYYPEFSNYMEYFRQYTIAGDAMKKLTVPVTVIASEDDPVVPVEDVICLHNSPFLNRIIFRYGGHCGFIERFPSDCWYEQEAARLFS